MPRVPGGVFGRLDNLVHHPKLAWLPRPLTSWVCDVMDHRLGMSWAEIRRARHGRLPGYTNLLDWRTFTDNAATTLGSNVVVHYKSGEVLRDD